MKTQLAQVCDFHKTFNVPYKEYPTIDLSEGEIELRFALIAEELHEYRQAALEGDIIGVADALTDLMYVVLGTYVTHGLQYTAEQLFNEVHRSNMSKLDDSGNPIFREDGKVLKSHLFSKPDLEGILNGQKQS